MQRQLQHEKRLARKAKNAQESRQIKKEYIIQLNNNVDGSIVKIIDNEKKLIADDKDIFTKEFFETLKVCKENARVLLPGQKKGKPKESQMSDQQSDKPLRQNQKKALGARLRRKRINELIKKVHETITSVAELLNETEMNVNAKELKCFNEIFDKSARASFNRCQKLAQGLLPKKKGEKRELRDEIIQSIGIKPKRQDKVEKRKRDEVEPDAPAAKRSKRTVKPKKPLEILFPETAPNPNKKIKTTKPKALSNNVANSLFEEKLPQNQDVLPGNESKSIPSAANLPFGSPQLMLTPVITLNPMLYPCSHLNLLFVPSPPFVSLESPSLPDLSALTSNSTFSLDSNPVNLFYLPTLGTCSSIGMFSQTAAPMQDSTNESQLNSTNSMDSCSMQP